MYLLAVKNISLNNPAGIVQMVDGDADKIALKIILPAYYEWVWLLSYDNEVMASTSDIILQSEVERVGDGIAITDGITKVPYRTATRIRVDMSKTFYLRGNGRIQIIAQNYDSCPFNTGSCGF